MSLLRQDQIVWPANNTMWASKIKTYPRKEKKWQLASVWCGSCQYNHLIHMLMKAWNADWSFELVSLLEKSSTLPSNKSIYCHIHHNSILNNGAEKKLSPWLIFLWTFLSKRLLHPVLYSLLQHIWLTGAPSVKRWVISFQQRGPNWEQWRKRYSIFYLWWHQGFESLLDGELSRRCSVSTDSALAQRCQCPFKALITPFPRDLISVNNLCFHYLLNWLARWI